jgi:nitrite reductase (NADH) large subunit
MIGLVALAGLVVHGGLRLGVNLNLALSASFLALTGAGSLAAVLVAARSSARRATRLLHLTLFWPALALVGLHVLTVYYF